MEVKPQAHTRKKAHGYLDKKQTLRVQYKVWVNCLRQPARRVHSADNKQAQQASLAEGQTLLTAINPLNTTQPHAINIAS